MRKLFAFNMVSLDGFFEGPDHDLYWHHVDEEFNQFAIEQTSAVGAILFGRVTYEMMASFWPTPQAEADDPQIAHLMNTLPKVVFSRTLDRADWANTRLVKGDLGEEVTKLKQEPGKDLAVFGSAKLLESLVQEDLVDEHRVLVNPLVLGSGTPLFKNNGQRVKLKLVSTRTFHNGNVLLVYEPDRV